MTTRRIPWRSVLTFVATAAAPLCMGNEGCKDHIVGDETVCEYGGKKYDAGDSFPSEDGCNTCRCSEDGNVACTARACVDDGCYQDGVRYEVGDTFTSSDGCNACTCGEGGLIGCDDRACPDGNGGCTFGGKQYDVGDSFEVDCNGCSCTEDGQIACTARACASTCDYAGKSYEEGDTFDATDGCNTCSCGADGTVGCTERDCSCTPSGWSQLRVQQSWGPCPPNTTCSNQWLVQPDGSIGVTREGAESELGSLNRDDFCSLVTTLGAEAFIAGMRQGFDCDEPPTDVFFSLELTLENETLQQSVTGCVTSGPVGNLAAAVVDVVEKY